MTRAPRRLREPSVSRRGFVRLLGGAAGVGLLPSNFACDPGGGARVVSSTFTPTPDEPLTPTAQFYINYNFGLPDAPVVSEWRLAIRGLVERTIDLSLEDLLAFDQVTREITLECIGNDPGGGLISSAAFTGVPLRAVMARAGIDPRGRGLRFLGLDGYPAYLPVEVADTDDALLVHAMNGEPIPFTHGAPIRALFPGRYGMFSCKWLDSITVARNYHTYGALSAIGSAVTGTTRVRSRIDGPPDGRNVTLGETVEVTGLAATPGLGVARVEVHAGGAWHPAELTFNAIDDGRSRYLWALWRFAWTPRDEGVHVLSVRAHDARGDTQSFEADFPYDSSAIHSVRVVVRR